MMAEHTFTEAPASWNIRYRVNGFDEQITLRGETYHELTETIDKARDYVRKLQGASPATATAHDAINVEPPAPIDLHSAPPTAPATNGSGQQPAQTGGTFRIAKMTVTPRADGKVTLNFFSAGHQYSDINAVKTPAEAAVLMQPTGGWTPEHFAVVAEYPVNCVIDWTPSANLNKNGKPYKNIAAVKAA